MRNATLVVMRHGESTWTDKAVNVPTGVPRAYEFTSDAFGGLRVRGVGRYLDPEAAAAGIAETKKLGRA